MCNINLYSDTFKFGSESERFIRIRIWIRILQNVRILSDSELNSDSDSDLNSDSDLQHCSQGKITHTTISWRFPCFGCGHNCGVLAGDIHFVLKKNHNIEIMDPRGSESEKPVCQSRSRIRIRSDPELFAGSGSGYGSGSAIRISDPERIRN